MRRIIPALILAPLALGGCSLLHANRAAAVPDEFMVARNAPLVIPPDYTLAPPVAGTSGIIHGDPQQQALQALFGGPAPRSASETSLLNKAGGDRAEVGIRSTAWDPDTRIVDKGQTTLTIVQAPAADSQVASAQVPQ